MIRRLKGSRGLLLTDAGTVLVGDLEKGRVREIAVDWLSLHPAARSSEEYLEVLPISEIPAIALVVLVAFAARMLDMHPGSSLGMPASGDKKACDEQA